MKTAFMKILCMAMLFANIGRAQNYKVVKLNVSIKDATNIIVSSFNDHDEIIGSADINGHYRSFLCDSLGSNVKLLPLLPGYTYDPYEWFGDINNLDIAIGEQLNKVNNNEYGVEYKNGNVINVGNTTLVKINDNNVIIGNHTTDIYFVIDNDSLAYNIFHSYVYINGKWTDINSTNELTEAKSINNKNWIVGLSSVKPWTINRHAYIISENPVAFLYKGGSKINLGLLNSNDSYSMANDINDNGTIVGASYDSLGFYQYLAKAFIWTQQSGMEALPVLEGTNWQTAYLINNSGLIVGASDKGPILWQNNKVQLINNLLTNGGQSYIDTVYALNNNNEILAQAYSYKDSTYYNVILKPTNGEIVKPDTSELVLANSNYEIKWENCPYKSLYIQFSLDDGATYTTVATGIPGSADSTSWKVPDTLSTKCRIRLVDESNATDTVVSSMFKVKGYELTRLDANGNYQLFIPDKDGWQFGNTENNMWPKSLWVDYLTGIDPNTHNKYTQKFLKETGNPADSVFPSWPLFAEAFGISQCYLNVNKDYYRPSALEKWSLIKSAWDGSCEGMAVSSLLAFGNKNQLLDDDPEIGTFNRLAELKINDSRRNLINVYWTRLFGITWYANWLEESHIHPRETLAELKEMLLGKTRNRALLLYYHNPERKIYLQHSVIPYRLKSTGENGVYYVYVYDPSEPLNNAPFITIDSTDNLWSLDPKGVLSSSSGLLVDIPATSFFYYPTLISPQKSLQLSGYAAVPETDTTSNPPASMFLQVYNTPGADIIIKNKEGKEIGTTADSVINQFADGIPIVPIFGDSSTAIGYYIPDSVYSIKMSNYPDSLARLGIMNNNIIFSAYREDAQKDQTDNFRFGNGFTVASNDNATKNFSLRMIVPVDTTEQLVTDIGNISLDKNDSLKINNVNNNEIKFVNYSNSGKTYDLGLWYASVNGQAMFNHDNIKIAANTTDEIVPDWQKLDSSKVLIRIDSGNDGSIDDSIYIGNQITNVGSWSGSSIPTNFTLYQNYPNPFNPTTTIKYDIPKASYVTLKVYDILGNIVKTLIDKEQQPGKYSVQFAASNSRLASGVYFYRLKAGSFVQAKKMMLLK